MASKPNKTALSSGTALESTLPPLATDTPPQAGDNSGMAGDELPLPADTHKAIAATLESIAKHTDAIEFARQKLSRQLVDRHAQLATDKPAGSVPFAHEMAVDSAKFAGYLNALATEFALLGASAEHVKAMTEANRAAFNSKIRRRLELALELFVRIEWHRAYTPSFVCEWHDEESRWYMSPGAFVPPGYTPSVDLMVDKSTGNVRTTIAMELEDKSSFFYVARQGRSPISITTAMSQFNHVFAETQKVLRNPTQDTSTVEPTAGRQKRKARQQNAKPVAATDPNLPAPDVATEDSDTPEATAPSAQTDRVWALGQFVRTIVAAERLLEHDTLADLSWSDLPLDGVNALTAVAMLIDKMNAKPDGKPETAKAGTPEGTHDKPKARSKRAA